MTLAPASDWWDIHSSQQLQSLSDLHCSHPISEPHFPFFKITLWMRPFRGEWSARLEKKNILSNVKKAFGCVVSCHHWLQLFWNMTIAYMKSKLRSSLVQSSLFRLVAAPRLNPLIRHYPAISWGVTWKSYPTCRKPILYDLIVLELYKISPKSQALVPGSSTIIMLYT